MNLVEAWETLLAGNCVQVDSDFGCHIYKLDENKHMKCWNFTDLKWQDSSFGYLTDSNYIENKEDPEKTKNTINNAESTVFETAYNT